MCSSSKTFFHNSKIWHRLVCLHSRLDGIGAESWLVSQEARTCVRPRGLLWQSQIKNKTRIPHVPDDSPQLRDPLPQSPPLPQKKATKSALAARAIQRKRKMTTSHFALWIFCCWWWWLLLLASCVMASSTLGGSQELHSQQQQQHRQLFPYFEPVSITSTPSYTY